MALRVFGGMEDQSANACGELCAADRAAFQQQSRRRCSQLRQRRIKSLT